jgi:hypothetical protein
MINTKEDFNKFKEKLRKRYIGNMTSEQYHIPADSKELATLKWINVSVVFDSVVEDFLKEGK